MRLWSKRVGVVGPTPQLCQKCAGKTWYELPGAKVRPGNKWPDIEACTECHRGWTGDARWVCQLRTDWGVCNPARTGGGHVGCGWYLPLIAADREVEDALF